MGYIETVGSGSDAYKAVELLLEGEEEVANNAPIFVMSYKDGSITGLLAANPTKKEVTGTNGSKNIYLEINNGGNNGDQVFVDFYVKKDVVREMQIDAANFGGFYYVEGSTLFRRESDGKDLPAEIVFPKVKIQSNFTFSMASSGDPSTFTFTMDAMPGYTFFNKTKKALCAIQIIDDTIKAKKDSAVTIAKKDGDYLIPDENESYNPVYIGDAEVQVVKVNSNDSTTPAGIYIDGNNQYYQIIPSITGDKVKISLPGETESYAAYVLGEWNMESLASSGNILAADRPASEVKTVNGQEVTYYNYITKNNVETTEKYRFLLKPVANS
jgi:hypothetical protein